MANTSFPNNLIDKYGRSVRENDVIFDGENYFRIYWNEKQPQVEAISPTYGYLHNLSQDEFKKVVPTYRLTEIRIICRIPAKHFYRWIQ